MAQHTNPNIPEFTAKQTSARGFRGNEPRMPALAGSNTTNKSASKFNHTRAPSARSMWRNVRW
jgi:hypothetical protein